MTKLVKGGDLIADAETVEAITTEGESPEVLIEMEAHWVSLRDWFLSKQVTPGQVSVPCGKGTGLFNRITDAYLPFGTNGAFCLAILEAGVRKPISDISIDNKIAGDSWTKVNERRADRLAKWKEGVFASRGGSKDELATQMKIEFGELLKSKGLPDVPANAEYFKGNVVTMVDYGLKMGMKFERDAMLASLRAKAREKLGDRGKAKEALDVSQLKFD